MAEVQRDHLHFVGLQLQAISAPCIPVPRSFSSHRLDRTDLSTARDAQ